MKCGNGSSFCVKRDEFIICRIRKFSGIGFRASIGEKFFFPQPDEEMGWDVLDLPFSKIVIHRHGGKVKLDREGENVVMRIE